MNIARRPLKVKVKVNLSDKVGVKGSRSVKEKAAISVYWYNEGPGDPRESSTAFD